LPAPLGIETASPFACAELLDEDVVDDVLEDEAVLLDAVELVALPDSATTVIVPSIQLW
jgi:hypothetical protein